MEKISEKGKSDCEGGNFKILGLAEVISKVKRRQTDFEAEMDYALNKFNWESSPLDAKAIKILNTWKIKLNELIMTARGLE